MLILKLICKPPKLTLVDSNPHKLKKLMREPCHLHLVNVYKTCIANSTQFLSPKVDPK